MLEGCIPQGYLVPQLIRRNAHDTLAVHADRVCSRADGVLWLSS